MTHWISQYGYLAVFVLMFAESACIPIPSEVIMMFGGALAAGAVPATGTGTDPSLIGIVIAGILGNVAGSYLSWAAGRYAGQAAISRWGRRIGIREAEIAKATSWFERHGPVAVLAGRVVPVIRTFISLPAGFADMPAGLFGLYTILGCVPWTAALGIAGYVLGANYKSIADDFHGPTYVIAGLIALGIAIAFVRHRRRTRAPEALEAHEEHEVREDFKAYESRGAYEPHGAYDPHRPLETRGARGGTSGAMPSANQSPYAHQPDPYSQRYR